MTGTVYTETLIHSAPEAFVSEAPYQLIIVTLDGGNRVTGRVSGDRVAIDDAVDARRRTQRRSLLSKNLHETSLEDGPHPDRDGVRGAGEGPCAGGAGPQHHSPGDRRARLRNAEAR